MLTVAPRSRSCRLSKSTEGTDFSLQGMRIASLLVKPLLNLSPAVSRSLPRWGAIRLSQGFQNATVFRVMIC